MLVAYTLTAPADRTTVVTPLTTLVQQTMASTGASSTEAASSVQSSLGLNVSVFQNYVGAAAPTDGSLNPATAARLIVVATQQQTTALVSTLHRSRPTAADVCDKRLLWRFGISGDRPLLLVHAGAPQGLGLDSALVGQRIEHVGRVELAAHEQARACVQRGHEHGAQTEDVGHGQVGVGAVLRPQFPRLGRHAGKLQETRMAHQHALGCAGRARREDDGRHLRGQLALLGHRLGTRGTALQTRQHRRPGPCIVGVLARRIRHAAGEVHDTRVGLGAEATDFTARHAGIHAT